MKNILKASGIISILFFSVQLQAQIRFGISAGLNLANASVANLPSGTTSNIKPSFHVGGMAEYSVARYLALEGGLLLSGKGTKIEISNGINVSTTTTYSPLSLEIPINAIYKIGKDKTKVELFAGPYIAIGVSGKIKTTGLNNESKSIVYGNNADADLKRTDFGLNFGAGVEINNFQIKAQYELGLTNLNPDASSIMTYKSTVLGISLGYMFGM